jgi:capsular polysaccharide biosynthesis protein
MEFKAIIAIFRKHKQSFWITVAVCIVIGIIGQRLQTDAVASNLTLNVTRLGAEKTADYQFHSFYRLQADERFADTIVRWIASPRLVADIASEAHLNSDDGAFSRTIKAERLSSQMIQMTYHAKDASAAQKIAQAIVKRVNIEADTLNADQQEASWFAVVGDEAVVRDARLNLTIALALSLVIGVFLGFWTVLLRHYFTK